MPAGYKAAFASQDVLVMQRFATDHGYLRACSRSSGRDSLVFTISLHHGLAANEPGYRALGSWLVIATYEGPGPTLSQDTGIMESFNVRTDERGYYVAVRSSALTAVDGPVPQLSPSFAVPFAMTNTGYFAWVDEGIPPGDSVPMSVLYAPSGSNGDRELDIAPGDGITDGITDLHSDGATIAYRKNGRPRTLRPGVALKTETRGSHRAAASWPRCEELSPSGSSGSCVRRRGDVSRRPATADV